jgi:hypothetical protein
MLNNATERLNGRLWFVSAPVVSGHYLAFDVDDDDALFSLVTDQLKFGSVATIIFDPRTDPPELRFYPSGLGVMDACEVVALSDQDITLDDIYPVIERVYDYCLVTPDAQLRAGKLWADQDRRWASSQAEAIVQLKLHAALVGAFLTCVVRFEQSMPEGRDDLEIERQDPLDRSKVTRLVLIELKVLRSFSETGRAVLEKSELGRIQDGVKQAAAYRNSKGFRHSTLCCFDMRSVDSGDSCFEHVLQLAVDLSVDKRRWFIYASSDDYRAAIAAGRSKP